MKPRVLQLISNLHPGGTEVQAVQLTRLLSESSRFEIHVATMKPERGALSEVVDRLNIGEVQVYPMTSFYNLNAAKQTGRFAAFLRKNKIDVIHAHDFYTNVFGMTSAALAGTPVRIASRRETTGWRTPSQKRVERTAYRLSHTIIANADAVRDQLLLEGVKSGKVVTVYNGLDLDRVKPSGDRAKALASLRLPATEGLRYVTLMANILHPVKDHRMFLRAARRVHDAAPETRFILAGWNQGEFADGIRAYAREMGLADVTFFPGSCKNVGDLLLISDVCVLSSVAEGFSNSIIEYMGAGRPVVATNVGGAREVILHGETGYLIEPGDDQTLANWILDLLRNPSRAEAMGRMGRRIVEERFTKEILLARITDLYERLLERAPARERLAPPIKQSAAQERH